MGHDSLTIKIANDDLSLPDKLDGLPTGPGVYQHKDTEGKVLYGDVDLASLDKPQLYRQMSAVFQNFRLYSLSIGDNVRIAQMDEARCEESVY